jgi:thiosulfate dehydrogenase [quinone] large subunit
MEKIVTTQGDSTLHNPPLVHTLFSTTTFAWLWAIVRIYVGYEWIKASLPKLGDPAWVSSGEALKGFWTKALETSDQSRPTVAYGWYRDFLSYMLENGWYTWFAKLVAYGELLVGIALILGAFVGLVAFFSAFMNWNYVMAGSASTNAMLLTLAVLLIIAWKVAGWYGLDRYLLPLFSRPRPASRIAEASAVTGQRSAPTRSIRRDEAGSARRS